MVKQWSIIESLAAEEGISEAALAKWRQRGVPHRFRLPFMTKAAERGLNLDPIAFDIPSGATAGTEGRT